MSPTFEVGFTIRHMAPFHFIDLPGLGRVSRDREPNFCPHCAHKIAPEELDWTVTPSYGAARPELECTCKCTNQDCQHLFVATYRLEVVVAQSDVQRLAQFAGTGKAIFRLASSYPRHIPKSAFSIELANLSSTFVEIYEQAEASEALGLGQVCGLGYRKAVEFLVKDYCLSRTPEGEHSSILSAPLAQCVSRFVDDSRIKDVANRAAWLGNDEAHYVRKWIDKDVSDLKLLIKLLCNWIESSILTEHYRSDMPSTK